MFIDRVTVKLLAGKGGNGIVSWRREKYIPKGGPCGGDGGNGGSVFLVADPNTASLEWFHYKPIIQAEQGVQGGTNSRTGRTGYPQLLKVPCGTLVKDRATGEVLHDLDTPGKKVLICQGGKGGKGNEFFKTPTNRAPIKCTPGKPGEEREVELELKLIADVGLVGFPNAGKSTLISHLANIRVKTAAYPFTTLTPNLGYLRYPEGERILLADVPGLIHGASQNKGLGFDFLRHIERTHLLIFLLDSSGIDGRFAVDDYTHLLEELEAYNPALLEKPRLVVLNKSDSEETKEQVDLFYERYPELKNETLLISALNKEGLDTLKERLRELFLSHSFDQQSESE